MHTKYKLIFISFLFVTVLGTAGCGKPNGTSVATKPNEEGPPRNVKEFSIKAQEGGAIAMEPGDGSRIKIVFPQGSLETDAALEVAPSDKTGDEVLSRGFSLQAKGSDQGPKLKYPALLFFYADKDLGKEVSIVRYKDDGSYDVLPTRVGVKDGKTTLSAQVMHFSDYGARKVSPQAIQQAKQAPQTSDFNWVMYVKDSADVNSGAMKRKINLDFKAINTSGDLSGEYTGYARAKTTNDLEASGRIDADFDMSDENVTFNLGPYIELGSLVPDDAELPLAKLEPAQQPDLMGGGTLSMGGSGVGTVSAGGRSYSRSLQAESSKDPFQISVTGPLVRLSVSITGVGTVYFDGYIRGEGR
jgi:hypothetical protein